MFSLIVKQPDIVFASAEKPMIARNGKLSAIWMVLALYVVSFSQRFIPISFDIMN